MVQKAAIMNIGLVAAISAPTSFAVSLAESAGLTLIGFMRDHAYVIYTHPQRLKS
jgi:FdhD protein